MKRFVDVGVALLGLLVVSPVLLIMMLLLLLQDGSSPLYIPWRVGRNGRPFRMFKLRSMTPTADLSCIDSTANDDTRITTLGGLIRKFKLDELPQLWNVLIGDMSLVGPRPNIQRETDLYTSDERRLLSVRPGITDISSIVFSDLGAILQGKLDANLAYNQLVRPYKSRLGLLYIDHASVWLDVRLIGLTLLNSVNRRLALKRISTIVAELGAPPELVVVTARCSPLQPAPPPGASEIVASRGA